MGKYIFNFDDFKNSNSLNIEEEKYLFNNAGTIVKNSNLKLSINASKYDEVVNIICYIKGSMVLECSRCLEEYIEQVDISFEHSFTKEEWSVDVTDEIEQNIILNIPMKPLCSQDCKGICQVCGNNKNKVNCSCCENLNKEFIEEKWKQIKDNWGKYAKSKKKTHSSS